MLHKLNAEIQARLRSGVAITSVAQCVEELVLNSIDAGATCVAVRVDTSCCKVQVVDNGTGMTRASLEKIAERYTTSKCHTLQDLDEKLQHFGYRGEALASIRDISAILEIESRAKQSTQTFTRVFQYGKPLSLSESKTHRPSAGTTITVHDLFHCLPVRRKSLNESLELERVRQRIEAIALIHPGMSLSLRNDAIGTKVLQTHKSNSVLGAFTFLFGNAKSRLMYAVSAESDSFKVNGFIGTEGHHNKSLQFIFVNDRLVLKTKIHKSVNYVMSKSSITRRRYLGEGSPNLMPRVAGGSPPKPTSERHGMFVINVTCPLSDYDITFDPTKTLIEFKDWTVIRSLVEEMVQKFLVGQNLMVKMDPKEEGRLESPVQEAEDTLKGTSQEDGSGDNGRIASLQQYAVGINTANTSNNLTSEKVSRPGELDHNRIVEEIIAKKSEEEKKENVDDAGQTEDDVESIPGNCLEKAAGRDIVLTCQETMSTEEESPCVQKICGRKQLPDSSSPLAFMYKTTQESGSSAETTKQQSTTTCESEVDSPGITMFSESPLTICKESAKSDENCIIISDSSSSMSNKSSPDDLNENCGQQNVSARVRDKTFISLDVPSDTSVEREKYSRPSSPVKAFEILKQKLQSKECTDKNEEESQSDLPSTSSLQEFQRSVRSHSHNPNQHRAAPSASVIPSTSSYEEEPIPSARQNSSTVEPKSQAQITLSSKVGFTSCLASFQNTIKPLSSRKDASNTKSCDKEKTSKMSAEQINKDLLNNFARIRKSLAGKDSGSKSQDQSVIGLPVHDSSRPDALEKEKKSGEDLRGSSVKISRAEILNDFSKIRIKMKSKEPLPTKQSSDSAQDSSNRTPNDYNVGSKGTSSEEKNSETNVQDDNHYPNKHSSHNQGPSSQTNLPSTSDLVTSTKKLTQKASTQKEEIHIMSYSKEHTTSKQPVSFGQFMVPPPAEMQRKRRAQAPTMPEAVPLAAKLSRLSRGQAVPKPPSLSRVTPKLSMMDEMVEATRRALIGARSKLQHHGQSTAVNVGGGDCLEMEKNEQRHPDVTAIPIVEETPKKDEVVDTQHREEYTVVPSTSNQRGTCIVDSQNTNQGKVQEPTISEERKSYRTGNTHNIPDVREAMESYKDKLYKRPFPFHVTPRVPEWKKTIDISFLSSMSEEEEEAENSNREENSVIKRSKVQITNNKAEPEKWKSDQLPSLGRSPIVVGHNPGVECSLDEQMMTPPILDRSHEAQSLNPKQGTPKTVETSSTDQGCEKPDSCQTNEDEAIKSQAKSETKEKEDNITTAAHNTPGALTIQALDYTLELEPLLHLAVPNMDLGSQFDDDRHINEIQVQNASEKLQDRGPSDTTTSKATPLCDVQVEPSKELSETVCSSAAKTLEEESQGFTYIAESQNFDLKVDTQEFLPTSSSDSLRNTSNPHHTDGQAEAESPPKESSPEDPEQQIKTDEQKTSAIKSPGKTLFVGQSWICKLDPNTGRKVFINKITGHSSYDTPQGRCTEIEKPRPVFQIKNPLLPSGATPLLQAGSSPLQARPNRPRPPHSAVDVPQEETESTAEAAGVSAALADHLENQEQEELTERGVKWRDNCIHSRTDISEDLSVEKMFETWENPAFRNEEQCAVSVDAGSSAKGASRVQQAIHPYKFTKDMFSSMKILGQVDNKFIACLVKFCPVGKSSDHELLTVVDQHAAHERVRLERLTAESYNENGVCVSQTEVDPEVEVGLKEEEVRVACAYRSGLEKRGILFRVENGNKTAIHVKRIPSCLLERDTNEKRRRRTPINVDTLKAMIREETELLQTTHGACSTIPQAVFRELCSQACHGAIKFGDPLTTKECEVLIKELSACKLPFQCAHGRPSVMPILDLDHLKLHQSEKSRIQLWKLRRAQDE